MKKDKALEEIDNDLRAINAKLKKLLSRTDALLKESMNETKESEDEHNNQAGRPENLV